MMNEKIMKLIMGNIDNEEEYLEAMQELVDTGLAWKLEGFWGRTAAELIDNGLIELPN